MIRCILQFKSMAEVGKFSMDLLTITDIEVKRFLLRRASINLFEIECNIEATEEDLLMLKLKFKVDIISYENILVLHGRI